MSKPKFIISSHLGDKGIHHLLLFKSVTSRNVDWKPHVSLGQILIRSF